MRFGLYGRTGHSGVTNGEAQLRQPRTLFPFPRILDFPKCQPISSSVLCPVRSAIHVEWKKMNLPMMSMMMGNAVRHTSIMVMVTETRGNHNEK